MSITGKNSIGNTSIPKMMPQTTGAQPTGADVIQSFAGKAEKMASKRAEAEAAAKKADTFLNRTFRKGKIKDLNSQAEAMKQAEDNMKKIQEMINEILQKAYATMYQ